MLRTRLAIGALTIATVIAGACSGDNGTGTRSSVDLSGSYGLDSLYFGALAATEDSGSLTLTTNAVTANITVIKSPDTTFIPNNLTLALSGQYQAWHTPAGDSVYFILVSPPGTFPGTFAIKGAQKDTLGLTLFVTLAPSQSILVTTRWHKK